MNYGLYLSATGVQSYLYRQDVLANNLANVETTGFKPDSVYSRERLPERLESGAMVDPHLMLERLGGGHFLDPSRPQLKQGNLQQTGNTLDLAIEGEGFFALDGGDGSDEVRLTRDGRFTTNTSGELIMAATGFRVLDASGRPIRLDGTGDIRVDAAGNLLQRERPVAQLQVVAAGATELQKAGSNTFRLKSGSTPPTPADGHVRQGFLEGSAVDPIKTLNEMISMTKNAQANSRLLQFHDHMMGQVINTYGRVG